MFQEGLTAADMDTDEVYFTNLEPFDKPLMETAEYRNHRRNLDHIRSKHVLFSDSWANTTNRQISEGESESISTGEKPADVLPGQLNHVLFPTAR